MHCVLSPPLAEQEGINPTHLVRVQDMARVAAFKFDGAPTSDLQADAQSDALWQLQQEASSGARRRPGGSGGGGDGSCGRAARAAEQSIRPPGHPYHCIASPTASLSAGPTQLKALPHHDRLLVPIGGYTAKLCGQQAPAQQQGREGGRPRHCGLLQRCLIQETRALIRPSRGRLGLCAIALSTTQQQPPLPPLPTLQSCSRLMRRH